MKLLPLLFAAAPAFAATTDFPTCVNMTIAGRTITCNEGTKVVIGNDVQPDCPAFVLGQSGAAFTLGCATPNATGMWWSPATDGHGTWISHQADTMFSVTYDYNADGTPTWKTMTAVKDDTGLYSGDVYTTTSPPLATTKVGGGWLAFDDADHVRVNFAGDVKGPLVRQAFGPLPTCRFGLPDDNNVTDLWWNPQESGWGVAITQQGTVIFMSMYVYAEDHTPTWFVGTLPQAEGTYAGTLYSVRGPAPPVNAVKAGTASLTFAGLDAATLTYDIPGKTARSVPITRQIFSAPGVGCRS